MVYIKENLACSKVIFFNIFSNQVKFSECCVLTVMVLYPKCVLVFDSNVVVWFSSHPRLLTCSGS